MNLWQLRVWTFILNLLTMLCFFISPAMMIAAVIALINLAWPAVFAFVGVALVTALGLVLGAGAAMKAEEEVKARVKASTETCWDRWDEIIAQGGHQSVLDNLPPSTARMFTPAGQPCDLAREDEEGRHEWKPILTRTRDDHVVGGKWRCPCGAETKEQTFAESMAWELKEIRRQREERETAEFFRKKKEAKAKAMQDRVDRAADPAAEKRKIVAEVVQFGSAKPIRTFEENDISEILRRQYGISTNRERVYYAGGQLAGNDRRW